MSALSLSRKRRIRESSIVSAQSENETSSASKKLRQNSATQQNETLNGKTIANTKTTQIINAAASSQQIKASSRSQLNGSVAETALRCGKILRMQLINFMCHSNLCIEFHSRTNFLVGCNGSGKSAVMAALVLALGGTARNTQRSTNLKRLIKSGENSAKIEIVISNEGSQAFEPEKLGDRITVVRNINQSGSSYIIKSAWGNVISRKADDLHRILLYHNVQVDNPVFVLNQDAAREFLKELDPKKNYKLFLKATQIEIITEKLNDCFISHNDQMYSLKMFRVRLEKDQQECYELKSKLMKLNSLRNLKESLSQMKAEYLWVLVAKHEMDLQKWEQEFNKALSKKQDVESFVSQKNQHELTLTQEISQYDTETQSRRENYSSENEMYRKKSLQVQSAQQRCTEAQSVIRTFEKRIAALQADNRDLQTNIDERAKINAGDIAELRRCNENSLNELRTTLKESQALMESTKRDLSIFKGNQLDTEEKVNSLKQKRREHANNFEHLKLQLNSLKASGKNKLSIYGNDVSKLVADIEHYYSAGRFAEMPRGPIGRYIEVPHAKNRDIVENLIGGLLIAFIVSCTKDRLTLESLLKQKYPRFKPTIITTKFIKTIYDVSRGCVNPPQGTCLLMDEIHCDDAVVMNCLIDHVHIETILLTDSKTVAERITANRENVPRNLRKVIMPEHGIEMFPDPHYRMYSMKIRPARYIQISIEDRLNQLKCEQEEQQQRIEAIEKQIRDIVPEQRANAQRIQEKRSLLEQHELKSNEIQEKIIELENFEYPDYDEIDVLKSELAANVKKLDELTSKVEDKTEELNNAKTAKAQFENELQEQKKHMQSLQKEITEINNKSEEARMKIRSLNSKFSQNQSKINEMNGILDVLQQEKNKKETLIAAAMKEAKKAGPREESKRTPEDLNAEIETLKAKISAREQIDEDPDELKKSIATKEEALENDKEYYKTTRNTVKRLQRSFQGRFEYIKRLRQHMIIILQHTFLNCLKVRNFTGSIEVNHEEMTLKISIVPRKNVNNKTENIVSSTKALSGGERSFSTIAFLISLWSCVDHPFYFLDEYDVFTDNVNRDIMTQLLIHEAKNHPHRQYTFLTPQGMNLNAQDFIKIHRLSEPERN